MFPLSLKFFLTVSLLSTDVSILAQQTPERNLTIPTPTTTTATTTSTTSPSQSTNTVGNNNNSNSTTAAKNGTTTATTNGNGTTTNKDSANHGNNSTTKLTPIPDATGSNGSIPFPAGEGGNAKGRYGPDDQYIASLTGKLNLPTISCLTIVTCTIFFATRETFF